MSRKKVRPVARKSCQICIRDLPMSSYAKDPTTANCAHGRDVCRSCLRHWIDARLDEGQFTDIKCPGPDCSEVMTQLDVERLIMPSSLKRYQNLIWRAEMNAEPRWRWCPASNCDGGMMRPDEISRKNATMKCKTCHVKSCLLCDRIHDSETCDEFLERTETVPGAEKASEHLIAMTVKLCPNPQCASKVTKISGCDHMTCGICRAQFCWECLVVWGSSEDDLEDEHLITCSHHPRQESPEDFEYENVTPPSETENPGIMEQVATDAEAEVDEGRDGIPTLEAAEGRPRRTTAQGLQERPRRTFAQGIQGRPRRTTAQGLQGRPRRRNVRRDRVDRINRETPPGSFVPRRRLGPAPYRTFTGDAINRSQFFAEVLRPIASITPPPLRPEQLVGPRPSVRPLQSIRHLQLVQPMPEWQQIQPTLSNPGMSDRGGSFYNENIGMIEPNRSGNIYLPGDSLGAAFGFQSAPSWEASDNFYWPPLPPFR